MVETIIKTIIFDLDNTLHDAEFLTNRVVKKTIEVMITKGMNCNLEEGIEKFNQLLEKEPNNDKIRKLAAFFESEDEEIVNAGWDCYQNPEFKELLIYSDTNEVLGKLKGNYKLILVSQGSKDSQNKRIDALGIRDYFEEIYLPERGKKKEIFEEIFSNLGLDANQILVVGDRIDGELKIANELGMQTCRIARGKYKILEPRFQNEEPDFTINTLRGLYGVLNLKNDKLKVVLIGGGTGTSSILEGMKKYTDNITVVVNVTDTGRSSGLIRKDFNILAPGDARNCLIALSNSEKLLCDLFQYRFKNGGLEGHSFGNLFIAALADLTGSFENAIEEVSKILELKGRVLPSTFDNINICAELEDGTLLKEENAIIDRDNNEVYNRSPIRKVFHNPIAKANEKALKAIEEADLIVLSPGSLYTSIVSNLLVEGIPEAIGRSRGKKVYVCNIMSQVSQTYGYKASDHVDKIKDYLKCDLDFVILNNKDPDEELIESYKMENAHLIENDIDKIENSGISVIAEDFLDNVKERKILWEKKNLLRHDPDKISEVLAGLV
ncbi:hypothetical protein CMI43_00540 [Candidatus Pacearchaeota archaeon]|jgi:uncharacterized cofD-like protein/HAD superfamily hydrolase (TIGR01549 family)|nr:hypothetical protein [Candidatus Pacearchaeota archaeon]|tara:strand:- start:3885 stop:5540 length:1656 start_codon:yes stop_codon:yes gene_type:complete